MKAQIVQFTLKPGHSQRLRNLCVEWKSKYAHVTPGFQDLQFWQDCKVPDRGLIIVSFRSEEFLEDFSKNPIVIELSRKARSFAQDEPQYSRASLAGVD